MHWFSKDATKSPVAVGVDPEFKVLMGRFKELPHSRPQLGPHLDTVQPEQLAPLLRQPERLIGLVRPQHGLMLRIYLTEAS